MITVTTLPLQVTKLSHDSQLFPLLRTQDPKVANVTISEGKYPVRIELDGTLERLFTGGVTSTADIQKAQEAMGDEIFEREKGNNILSIALLNGGLPVSEALESRIEYQNESATAAERVVVTKASLEVSSYDGTKSKLANIGELTDRSGNTIRDLAPYVSSGKIYLNDDILDTGQTMMEVIDNLERKYPAIQGRISASVLFSKKTERRTSEVDERFQNYNHIVGIETKDWWLVGGGLDYQHFFRDLPGGAYVFNADIVPQFERVLKANPEHINKQIGIYKDRQ